MSAERLSDKQLAGMSRWADDGGNGAGHIFHGECPWCTIGAHDLAASLLAEVARLRQIEEAATAWADAETRWRERCDYPSTVAAQDAEDALLQAVAAGRAALPEAPQDQT